MSARKIVQIAATGTNGECVLVLCDDNSLWRMYVALGTWQRIDTDTVEKTPNP